MAANILIFLHMKNKKKKTEYIMCKSVTDLEFWKVDFRVREYIIDFKGKY